MSRVDVEYDLEQDNFDELTKIIRELKTLGYGVNIIVCPPWIRLGGIIRIDY